MFLVPQDQATGRRITDAVQQGLIQAQASLGRGEMPDQFRIDQVPLQGMHGSNLQFTGDLVVSKVTVDFAEGTYGVDAEIENGPTNLVSSRPRSRRVLITMTIQFDSKMIPSISLHCLGNWATPEPTT